MILAPPVIPFFTQPDPHAVDNPQLSPYAYCGGNPVMAIDPNGKDIFILNYGNDIGHMHLAMLIQDEDEQWAYYSVNGIKMYNITDKFGLPYNNVGDGKWDSPQEFLDSDFNSEDDKGNKEDKSMSHFKFSEGYQITTSKEQDAIMRNEFSRIADTEYDLIFNNCAHAVQKSMIKAGLDVDVNRNIRYSKMSTSVGVIYSPQQGNDNRINLIPYNVFKAIMNSNPNGIYIKK